MDEPERIAVVTGGAGAIGTAVTRALQGTGHRTVVLDRNADADRNADVDRNADADRNADVDRNADIDRNADADRNADVDRVADFGCDLSSEASTRAAAAAVLERHGRCDVLVHCAAVFDRAAIADVDAATWRRVQAVNVESALWLIQAFVPGMAQRRFGRIVFIASDTFWAPPNPAMLAYIASKGALLGIMRTLAVTLGADGIGVSAVAPGLTDTPDARSRNGDEHFDAVIRGQALKRPLTPGDTAAAVSYLVSDAAAAMTGQVLCADGGLIMR